MIIGWVCLIPLSPSLMAQVPNGNIWSDGGVCPIIGKGLGGSDLRLQF
ncbi:MAG: Uncharacterised protein [Flavobacteriia bacterium]|nr:MAG: Uncharacterised protein [Flavobacteriia bacterium]